MLAPPKVVAEVFDSDTCRCFFAVGTKGSGKTACCLAYVYKSLMEDKYDEYYLYLPSFSREQKKSYHWLIKYKNVHIVEEYCSNLSDYVLERSGSRHPRAKDEKKREEMKRIFYFLDDITAVGRDATFTDNSLITIMMESRHRNIDLWINAHTLKYIISPAVRANMDRLFIMKITNSKLVEDMYDAYFSMTKDFPNFKMFREFYIREVLEKEYNGICLDALTQKYCFTKDLPMITKFFRDLDANVDALKPSSIKEMKRININKSTGEAKLEKTPAPGTQQPLTTDVLQSGNGAFMPPSRFDRYAMREFKEGRINHFYQMNPIVAAFQVNAMKSMGRNAKIMRGIAGRMSDRVADDSDDEL